MEEKGQVVTGGMKCPKFDGRVEEFEEWKDLVVDWMETGGRKLEFPCLKIRQSLRGKALEVTRRIDRDTLKTEDGFTELMRSLDKFFMKDKDSEKLMKATEYFSATRKSDEKVTGFLIRQEKIRNDWKRIEGNGEEMEMGRMGLRHSEEERE